MNDIQREADDVWNRISAEVRHTRKWRRRRTLGIGMAMITTLVVGLAILGRPPSLRSTASVQKPTVVERSPRPETWAVFVCRDGRTVLEALELDDLGNTSLPFSLDPVVAMSAGHRDSEEVLNSSGFGFDSN